jgi:hypothetical protein
MEMSHAYPHPTRKCRRLNWMEPSPAMQSLIEVVETPPAPTPLLHKAPANTQTTDPPTNHMETRGRPTEEYWPEAGTILNEHPGNTQTVEEQSYASTLGAKEMLPVAECKHHFDGIPRSSWERTSWPQHCLRRHFCHFKARSGRPFVRTDTRAQRWFCSDHDLLQPRRQSKLLELPGEIRNEIYKYAFRPFSGLIPPHEESSMSLLGVNKQVHKEVVSLMYGTKPLRLIYDEDDLKVDHHSFDWGGQYYPPGLNWESNISGLLRLLGREAFEYVNDIEIFLDVQNSENAQRTILLDFVDALRTKRKTRLKRLTMKLTSEEEELGVSHFLQAFREVPEFKDIRFELEHPHRYEGKTENSSFRENNSFEHTT